MTPWLVGAIALLVALAPCLPLNQISVQSLKQARDYWLLALLALATIWLAAVAPIFAPIGLWGLVHWRTRHVTETMVSWAGLAGFWIACQALPADAWPIIIRPAWCLIGTVATGTLVWQWYWVGTQEALNQGHPWWHPYRHLHAAGWFGQRTLAGAFFALVLPFYPAWALPIPLVGLFVTSSWAAYLAALGAAIVLWPIPALVLGGSVSILAAFALVLRSSGSTWHLLEYTPRGDSLDSVWQRVRVIRLLVRSMAHRAWWPWGYGTRVGSRKAMEMAVIRWAARYGVTTIPTGHPHCDLLHFFFEYGVPGVAIVVILGALAWPRMAWGDPYTACLIAGGILAGSTLPFRSPATGLLWLAAVAHLVTR